VRGRNVDLGSCRRPHWHRKDGGPFIGSGSSSSCAIPTAAGSTLDLSRAGARRNKVTIQFDHPGRHGAIIAKKLGQGQSCPSLWSTARTPPSSSRFEYLPTANPI